MGTGSGSAIEIILLILAAPAVLILSAYGLVTWWRKKTQEGVQQIGERILGFDSRLEGMHHFLEEYAGINQEPYATPLNALQEEVVGLQSELEAFLETVRGFDEEIQNARIQRLQDIINAPIDWYNRWQRSSAMQKESVALEERLSTADQHIEHITGLPWELAQQCRQLEKDLGEVQNLAQSLQSKGVRGANLQTIQRQIPIMSQALEDIPETFLEGDQEAVLAHANEKNTVQTFEILSRTSPAVRRYLPQLRAWDESHQKAAEEFAGLKQAGATLRQAIANPPAGLVITDLQSRLDQIVELAAGFSQRLQQPDAEDLKPLSREITQLRKVIEDTLYHLNRSGQQAETLRQAIQELSEALGKLKDDFQRLQSNPSFPMLWDASGPLLADLQRRLQALGQLEDARTPEQVARQLKDVETIRTGQKDLAARVPIFSERYRDLTLLLDTLDLKEGAAWINRSREMLSETSDYDPRNWTRQDALHSLAADLDALQSLQEKLVPADRSAPVQESGLEQRLDETRTLAAQHKALRPRVESVRTRLEKVQSLEAEGKDRLNGAFTALERVALLTESNDILYEITQAEIERLSEEVQQANNELNARAQGEIEKKMQKVNGVTEKVNRALNSWLGRLNEAITEQGKSVSDLLAQVDAVGGLDEPSVIDAHNLITRDEYLSALRGPSSSGGSTAGRLRDVVLQRQPLLSDLEVTAEIKRKSDFLLTVLSVQQAMQEKTGSLVAAYQEAVQARNEAREHAAEVTRRIPGKRAWPPNNQTQIDDSTLLKPADDRWDAMKSSLPRKIDTAILDLGRLTQQYRLASERASQVLNRVDQDEERVKDLVDEIEDLKQRWQTQAQSAPNNPVIREGIQHLMSMADSRLAYIKQQYIRGALSYEETIHNLRLLNDELFAARVPVDENNDVGLNETPRQIGAG